MKNILSISLAVLFLACIFSINSISEAKSLQEYQREEAERCNKSIFSKIKCKSESYNLSPSDYFKKRKKCSNLRDRADTVYQGKQLYKQCMDRYS